jgi:hypothetical protein
MLIKYTLAPLTFRILHQLRLVVIFLSNFKYNKIQSKYILVYNLRLPIIFLVRNTTSFGFCSNCGAGGKYITVLCPESVSFFRLWLSPKLAEYKSNTTHRAFANIIFSLLMSSNCFKRRSRKLVLDPRGISIEWFLFHDVSLLCLGLFGILQVLAGWPLMVPVLSN